MKMKISLNKLITCLILVLNVASYGQDDYGQSLPGQLDSKTSPYEDDNYKIKEEDGTQFENIFGASPQG